jgi:hypothetical protein
MDLREPVFAKMDFMGLNAKKSIVTRSVETMVLAVTMETANALLGTCLQIACVIRVILCVPLQPVVVVVIAREIVFVIADIMEAFVKIEIVPSPASTVEFVQVKVFALAE